MEDLKQQTPELRNPITGMVTDATNVDDLIEEYESTKSVCDLGSDYLWAIRKQLFELSEGEPTSKTRRVRGRIHRALLTLPADNYDQGILKEAWNAYPELAQKFLRIERLAPIAKEVKKMANETGPPDFEQFKKMVLSAPKPIEAPPTVKIEE